MVPPRARRCATYYQIERYGFVILFALLFLLPGIFDTYFSVTVLPLLRLITGA